MNKTYYQQLNERKISVLFVGTILKEVGVNISNRRLYEYFEDNLKTCKDPRIRLITRELIARHDKTMTYLKETYSA